MTNKKALIFILDGYRNRHAERSRLDKRKGRRSNKAIDEKKREKGKEGRPDYDRCVGRLTRAQQ